MAREHAYAQDDGTALVPGIDSDWTDWVSASRTRNYCGNDLLLDWLGLFGAEHGFQRDDEIPGYVRETDFLQFIFDQGNAFEDAVLEHLRNRYQVVEIAEQPRDVRDREAVERTMHAMCAGTEIIAQAVLWNPENMTYGAPDLLVRSDVLSALFPGTLSEDEIRRPAVGIGFSDRHYRVVDVKFTTLQLDKHGHAGSKHLAYMAQVWVYNEALGRIQDYTPPSGYLLGRRWKTSSRRGSSALQRLARIDHDHSVRTRDSTLREIVADACAWYRRLRRDGSKWQALPEPTNDALRPNLRNYQDQPWHGAKREIAAALEDLTMLPYVSVAKRNDAVGQGLCRWTEPACSADALEVTSPRYRQLLTAVLLANQSSGPPVLPARIDVAEEKWRTPAPVEFYVDFETVSDLDDDFQQFPLVGGQPLIFMVGLGYLDEPNDVDSWQFEVFTADTLTEPEEHRILGQWLTRMQDVCASRGCELQDARIFHWSHAETSTLVTAYNAAAERHGLPDWNGLPWIDLLKEVIKAQPVTVRGAFGFGLKAIAKSMFKHGLIQSNWEDGPADGLGAMVAAWSCDKEAAKQGVPMATLPLMQSVEAYNEIDCRVMAEVLAYLRKHR